MNKIQSMDKISIYIDFGGQSDGDFAEILKSRLSNIKDVSSVNTFRDISSKDSIEKEIFWEKTTLDAIRNSTIIIPILSEDYFDFLSKEIEKEYDKILSSDDKYLFPILFRKSSWGSKNWVVKSKLIPSNGFPLSELNDIDSDNSVNELIKRIKLIVDNRNKSSQGDRALQLSILNNNNVVFISHDHDDADFAELLKLKLEKSNIISWIDSERLKIGQDWREEIDQGIENSIAVIVIMTPDSRKSEYVTYEWAFAWGKKKKIFPVMLKQTQLHPRLESLQYLDFTNRTNRPWDKLIDSINEIMKNLP